MPEPIIDVRNLSGGYGNRLILNDVSFQIYPNEVVVILGSSGSGKTTLLKHLIGLMKPQAGEMMILGEDISKLDEVKLQNKLQEIGVLFQNGALLNSVPLHENIAIPIVQHSNLSDKVIHNIVHTKLKQVGLEKAVYRLPSELSGGMRKRAGLARALALDPKILFADEPGAGLDPITAKSLDELLLSLKKQLEMTLVIVTHEVASIKRVADRVIYLHHGQIIFNGSVEKALNSTIYELKLFFDD
jgi:phospholipid/cholesterol/gamma-HCH transport system ATP-binding protein